MYEISSGLMKVGINPIGAELEYIKIKDINVLWERSDLWNSQSPILFPIIGALREGFYFYQGQRYEMKVHGFVKDMTFEVAHLDNNKIVLSKKYDDSTLMQFPFKFELLITYRVNNDSLNVEFEIKNLDVKDMSFSIGIHPGFSYKGLQELLGDSVKFRMIPNKLNEIIFSPSFVKGKELSKINYNTFDEMSKDLSIKRTICLEGLKKFEIYSEKHKLLINNNMSYMAFWQKNPEFNPEFICIEGWEGIPDMEAISDFDIYKKSGNKIIKENEKFVTSFEIIYK